MNQKVKLSELSNLSINQVIDLLGGTYTKLIEDGTDLDVFWTSSTK